MQTEDKYLFKTMSFEVKSQRVIKEASNDEFFVFSGYGSTFAVDSVLDQIMPGAFKSMTGKEMPPLLWSHQAYEPAIGIVLEAKEDNVGLFITGKMPMADKRVATEIKPQMELGSISQMSIGFRMLKYTMVEEPAEGEADRLIHELDLREISLVNRNFAANSGARVTALEKELKMLKGQDKEIVEKRATSWQSLPKSLADRERRWDASAAKRRWRAKSGSQDEPSATYRKNFLWFDAANSDSFGAYKLPIGDVVDGQHKAIPRGIFAARAAMAGARGGVNIPAGDRSGVQRNINRYYKAMDMEEPFKSDDQESVWTKDEILSLSPEDFKKIISQKKTILATDIINYLSEQIFSKKTESPEHSELLGMAEIFEKAGG